MKMISIKIIFKVELDSAGLKQFTFEVDSFENENYFNNSYDIAIDVIDSEYKILMEDHVHPDANTIGKSLESDINIDFEIISVAQENIQLSGMT